MDTIFALATARGRSGVAVIRISGSKAFETASGWSERCLSHGTVRLRQCVILGGDRR
jgi:tRNA U34 5-carboxymethylaminomethyl modifying GTPase MnmE/TrmE